MRGVINLQNRKKRYLGFIIVVAFIAPFNLFFNTLIVNYHLKTLNINNDEPYEKNNLKTSDIAGTDLYAEQINAYVAGNKSLIKQSLFTNDTNIFSQFDINDPAFYKCNILISASNTINHNIFPKILTESDLSSQYALGFNSFVGFLYYDNELTPENAKSRSERALEIIRSKFQIDLIMVNTSESNFFPFVGYYPDWEIYLQELTYNLPMDGYWKALDIDRLKSENYFKNHHISSTFMVINSLDFFESDFNITTDQLNFNFHALDLSFLENLETGGLIEQLNNTIQNFEEVINTSVSEEDLVQFLEILSSFSLSNDSHYTTFMIQYEGVNEGIRKIGKNQYEFSLWDALGYEGAPLSPSEKIYIALIGAFMSDIEINILCTDIIDTTPLNFKFYDYLLEQISLLFYLAGAEFDVQTLRNYSFELFWFDDEGVKRSYIKPVNLNDTTDIINLLQLFGFQGLPYIPTGIVNPFEDFIVKYNVSYSEPNLLLKKELIGKNASYGAYRNFSYYISAKNVGNVTAWGVPTPLPIELDYFFSIISPFPDELKNEMWKAINIEYPNQYESLEDFFNFDEDPRIFYFDTYGTGVFDTFYPNYLNITNLWPYNEVVDKIFDIVYPDNEGYFRLPLNTVKELFMNERSIWNDDNWRLYPGEIISYQVENISISNLDTFSPFYRNNFSIETSPETPEIVSGTSLYGTTPQMALATDNQNWTIGSIEKFAEQRIDIDFIFKNETIIDFINNSLEMVSIIINFTASQNLDELYFKIYNFEVEEFYDMTPYLTSIENNTWKFSISNNNESLKWLFYPGDPVNFTTLFKLYCSNSEQFNISIEDLDIEFSTRDININDDSGSRLIYGSKTGYVQMDRRSNSIPLSTFDMASVVATANLSRYSSRDGELNTYLLKLENIGSDTAKNINISATVPGIINNPNSFTLKQNNLTYFLSNLAPSENILLNFTFYTPNTRSIKDISISYENPENIQGGNSTKIMVLPNEVYVSAPIDYDKRYPFIRTIEIFYNNNSKLKSEDAPAIGTVFNLSVNIKNRGPFGFNLSDLQFSMNDQFGDLKRVENKTILCQNIAYNDTITFNITLEKLDWKGYYYPPINFFEGSETNTIQIYSSTSKLLGRINFSLSKRVDKEQVEIGERIIVTIELKNTGTISVNDVRINDMISYSQSEFALVKGNLINVTSELAAGETISFKYIIKAKKQAFVSLQPASISYYYLLKREENSNIINIKIITPQLYQSLFVIIPSFLAILIIILYIWRINKYKLKKSEYERTEIHFFDKSSRESILTGEHTLRERLRIISKELDNQRDD
ncbi:MAG: BatD family protein [Promethearchaeota archaeon]